MHWKDIVMLTFACVSANHLGLIAAMERVLNKQLPILNCPKCLTFWCVLFTTFFSGWNMVAALAISFLCAYAVIWIELGMGFVDSLYDKLYEKIYSTTSSGDPSSTDAVTNDSNGILSNVSEEQENI
jgi:hypothetical protein